MTNIIEAPILRGQILSGDTPDVPPFHTGNIDKQTEIQRILNVPVLFVPKLYVPEIQSAEWDEVIKAKAIAAWQANGFSPVIVEDVALEIPNLKGIFPPTYVNEWSRTTESRRLITRVVDGDRRAVARTSYAVYDGAEVHIRTATTNGTISTELRGGNGFGWDDMFVPEGQIKTFAEMTDDQKDSFSMRRMALEAIRDKPFPIGRYAFQMLEPFPGEESRIRKSELHGNPGALQFAFQLEALAGNTANERFEASNFSPIHEQTAKEGTVEYYKRYTLDPTSPSLGLVFTDITKARIEKSVEPDGDPIIYRMGPRQRELALAQRALFYNQNQNELVHNLLNSLEKNKSSYQQRPNRRHAAVDRLLDVDPKTGIARRTPALEQLGYKKISTDVRVSRKPFEGGHTFNKIGKYYRRMLLGGSMPPATGGRDALVTAAVGHMAIFIPRNSIFAGNIDKQIALAKSSHVTIDNLPLKTEWKIRAKQNIGVSLGIDDPQKSLEDAKRLYKEGGIRLFRIYTIGADPRIVETARLLRNEFGDSIEIFVGQIPDVTLGKKLIEDDIRVDAIIFGHGGGRQCTSADNGMGVTTLEEIYDFVRDPDFNNTTLLVEGGVGRNIASALMLGIDGIIYNGRLVRGTIESPAGDLYLKRKGKFVQPYPGSASAETQLIESFNPQIRAKRTNAAGRIVTEGSPGFSTHERKAGGSMVFWINGLDGDITRAYADIGVSDISQLRKMFLNPNVELLREVDPEARAKGTAYGNS